ncbi:MULTISPECIES: prepilin-type N-terminal cleavage/methylation domain-containing protein [Sulfurimonas]|uniref:Prepilin-type N-terminal cleavage/methylation domain-containing protein n=1 Tax=Sulfurimonas diazotrophicus TaxID=3131939 RepID=A0ABZ3H7X8_9BACT
MRMYYSRLRRAFTMIELVFVIVIMGILAKFGVEIFLQIYESYTRTTIAASLLSKSEAAVSQIANRLTYRVKDSIIASSGAAASFVPLSSVTGNETVFEWIGLDSDGWDNGDFSGIIDLNDGNTTYTQLHSPGTATLPANGALLFIGSKVNVQNSFGWHDTNVSANSHQDLYVYDGVASQNINFTTNPFSAGDEIFEFYHVADSAYALVLDTVNHKLYLHQNYQPWQAEIYTGTGDLLTDNVKTFTLQKAGDIIRIELCLSNKDFMDEGEYSICKTKIVF